MKIDLTTPAGALRLIENDIEKNFPGGRIVLVGDNGPDAKTAANPDGDQLSEDMKITQVTVLINYRKNDAMVDWPRTADDQRTRRFTLHITEEVVP